MFSSIRLVIKYALPAQTTLHLFVFDIFLVPTVRRIIVDNLAVVWMTAISGLTLKMSLHFALSHDPDPIDATGRV